MFKKLDLLKKIQKICSDVLVKVQQQQKIYATTIHSITQNKKRIRVNISWLLA